MKKLLSMLLCLLLATAVLAGCTGGEKTDKPTQPDGPANTDANAGVHYDENGALYVPRHDGVTLTIGIPVSTSVLDYKENDFTKWLEEMTGITLEFKTYAAGSANYMQQLATETASGSVALPDLLLDFNMGADMIATYGEDGYLMDLTDYLEDEYESAIFWERMNEMREDTYMDYNAFVDRIWTFMHSNRNAENTDDAGAIYGMPRVTTSLTDILDFNPQINTNWLKKVNKEMPTNWDELVDVLRAFKNGDPNGNGKADEVPMIGGKNNQFGADIIAWLLNFWVYSNNERWFNLDDNGKVYLPHTTEDYRDGMAAINALIDEGLLHTKSLSYDNASLGTVLTSGDIVGIVVGHPTLMSNITEATADRFESLNLYGNVYYVDDAVSIRQFITTDCTNVDAAWDLLMLMYTKEGFLRQRHGAEGVYWEWPTEDVMSPLGLPCGVKVLKDDWWNPSSAHWQTVLTIGTYPYHDLVEVDPNNIVLQAQWKILAGSATNQKAAVEKTLQTFGEEHILPWLRFNEEEDEIAPDIGSLKKEIEAWMSKFILGEKDAKNDADWAEYISVLEKAGLKRWTDATQMCYDRMFPNGHTN